MEIHLSARNLKLTGALRAYITQKISCLEHLSDQIIGAHVVVHFDENNTPTKQFHVKVHVGIPGPDIHVEQYARDCYEAIDKVETKLMRQLRKRKTKVHEKRQRMIQREAERKRRYGR
jgi:putative sigma-54 modulation protein